MAGHAAVGRAALGFLAAILTVVRTIGGAIRCPVTRAIGGAVLLVGVVVLLRLEFQLIALTIEHAAEPPIAARPPSSDSTEIALGLMSLFKQRESVIRTPDSCYGIRRNSNKQYAEERAQGCIFENYTVSDLMELLKSAEAKNHAFQTLVSLYQVTRDCRDMSSFRLGPNVFEKIPLDWIIFASEGTAFNSSELIGHGVTTRIPWNGDWHTLKRGWQGIIRGVYDNCLGAKKQCNTLIGLFINIEAKFRQHGWALKAIQEMKQLVHRAGLESLIIPLRLPRRYERAYAGMQYKDFAFLKREDGQFLDHWLRLHVRAGAEIIGVSESSHQHAMNLDDLSVQFQCERIDRSGYHLALRNGEWFQVFVDIEHDFALIAQGCVWVKYAC